MFWYFISSVYFFIYLDQKISSAKLEKFVKNYNPYSPYEISAMIFPREESWDYSSKEMKKKSWI